MRSHRPIRHDINVHLDSITITLPPTRVNLVQAPAPRPAPRPVDVIERTVVRPQMFGNDMFFFPEQEVVPAPTANESNIIADFFNWLFGLNKAA